MATPLLSLCIPTYNRADWLKACLDSCLSQAEALPDGLVEVVVSDNASPDRTPDLLAEYLKVHPALRVHCNENNLGAANFDIVLRHARGRYAWLMGDDDALLPGALAHVVGLIQADPRDFYLPHVVVDSNDPGLRRLEWFEGLPRLDWDLSDPAEFLEYMRHGRSASAVFSFISVLIFLREPWLEAVALRAPEFIWDWPQVVTALEYVKHHGRLRVIPEALVNYHCSTGSWGEAPWDRAMIDLRGLLRVAGTFFPDDEGLFSAFMANLRKNHGDGWIALHRTSAPDSTAWAESKALLLKAGYDPVKIAAVELGSDLLAMRAVAHPRLAPAGLCVADLGFLARGSRRTLVLVGRAAMDGLDRFLAALRARTHAEILVLLAMESPEPVLPEAAGIASLRIDLGRFAGDAGHQKEVCDSLREFAPDLVVNTDWQRHLAWDLMAGAAEAVAGLAFRAPARTLEPQVAAWLDSRYQWLLPQGSPEVLAEALGAALGLGTRQEPARPRATPTVTCEGPMKLNLGCGLEHLPGWVNVDRFAESGADLVHDLERCPWPFPDDSAEEVLLKHVLEHLGKDSDTFLAVMRELYRVCAPGAAVRIMVPHPRHQDFLQDPTHVRAVLPEMFQHFSLAVNEEWARHGLPGTPLARYLGIDFAIESTSLQLDPRWDQDYRSGRLSREALDQALRDHNNVAQSIEIVLRAVKPFGQGAARTLREPLPVRWEGSQFVYHSLAHVNRQLCLGLLGQGGVELSLVPYEPDQFDPAGGPFQALAGRVNAPLSAAAAVHVRHQWPPSFAPPAEGAWVIIQPWEFGGIPAEWVGPMANQVDEIWVPTAWVRDCYVQSGIPAGQVVVVPNGVDPQVFRPDGPRFPLRTQKGCRFLFLGGTIYRKGIDLLLEAYLTTFRAEDDVCLVIKGQSGAVYGQSEMAEGIRRIREKDPGAPEIEFLDDALDQAQVASLYRACDVLVLPYRGEGFGLPIAEAMASGRPVIVTGRGAAMDFVREDWAWLIPSRTLPQKQVDDFHPSPAGFWLEEPDVTVLGDLLARALAEPDERREKGRRAREYAAANLGWERPVALVRERLRALAGRAPRRRAAAGPAVPAREAFLYPVDWAGAEWVEVLLSFLQAFGPAEPVALVLPWEDPGITLEQAQGRLLALLQQAGRQTFPDLILVDKAEELEGILQGFRAVHRVPGGRGSVAGLEGPLAGRFAFARKQICQS